MKHCCEQKAAQWLSKEGFEYYLAVRPEIHQWSDRRKVIQKCVIPGMIFVRCLDSWRVVTLQSPYITHYMMKARGTGEPAVVPDAELENFRRFIERAPGSVSMLCAANLRPGDKIKVIDGPLAGCTGELASVNSTDCILVRIGLLGAAATEISAQSVVKLSEEI